MKIVQSLIAILAVAFCFPARGQQSNQGNCPLLKIAGASSLPAPADAVTAKQVKVVSFNGNKVQDVDGLVFTVVGGVWSLDNENFKKIQAVKGAPNRTSMQVLWLRDGQVLASQRFLLVPDENQREGEICAGAPPAPTSAVGTAGNNTEAVSPTLKDCQPLLDTLETSVRQRLGSNHFVVVVFKPTGEECVKSKPRGTSGDLIYTAMFGKNPGASVEFSKCDAPALSPNNPEGETLISKLQAKELLAPALEFTQFPARQCFGTAAEMTVKNKIQESSAGTKEVSKNFTLGLFDRFRFTLQAGVLGSAQHSSTFGLRKDGDNMLIYNKGPVGHGPEYVAAVVLYGLPHYFGVSTSPKGDGDGEKEALEGYFGRDPIHDNGFADRLGFVLGAGLNNPGDRIVAGLAFELGFGINLIGVYEYAKTKELVGASEGSVFTGTVEQIPTRDAWKGRWIAGVSVDMRYFTRLTRRASS
jgi:hypothetical protein